MKNKSTQPFYEEQYEKATQEINVTEERKQFYSQIAELQGFRSASAMALFALNQYVTRNKLGDRLPKDCPRSTATAQYKD